MGTLRVLRLGHRPARDKRITTHVGLVARAFGAASIAIHEPDKAIAGNLRDVTARFGGPFEVETPDAWRPWLRAARARGDTIVHLTMYGLPLSEVAPKCREALAGGDLTIVVGAEKVPGEVYQLAHHNVAVGNQPHSEVAALAILLDRITEGAWEAQPFSGPMHILPTEKGKSVRMAGEP